MVQDSTFTPQPFQGPTKPQRQALVGGGSMNNVPIAPERTFLLFASFSQFSNKFPEKKPSFQLRCSLLAGQWLHKAVP